MARPKTPFSQEKADEICTRLASGESILRMVETDDSIPPQSVIYQWLSENPNFAESYARARQFWAESEFEKMMRIADTPELGVKVKTLPDGKVETIEGDMTEHRKLQIDARKWALARMSPRKYGDAMQLKHSDPEGNTLKIEVTRVGRPAKKSE